MIDLIYLIIVLLIGSQLAKLSISGTAYALLLGSAVIFVLASSFLILNNPDVSAVTSGLARYIEQFGIGDPDTWRYNSKAFHEVIDGCYYLMFFSAALCLFISASYEGKGMEMVRNTQKNGVLIVLGYVFLIAIIFHLDLSSSGFTSRKVRMIYNSEFTFLLLETFILYAVIEFGKSLRAIFNKQI